MAVKTNATMTFVSYEVEDAGVRFHFVCPDPGPGELSDYYLPSFDTWSRNLRLARNALQEQKNTSRRGRR